MAQPTNKHPAMDKLLERMVEETRSPSAQLMQPYNRREQIASGLCVPKPIGCGGRATEFKDELSRREFTISGLCQNCQDAVFGKGGE